MSNASSKIAVINGLRGWAIIGVIFHHVVTIGPGFHALQGSMKFPPFTIFTNGFQAVALFFVLSGFVLYLPYAQGRRDMKTLRDALTFYRRRVLRLYPLYIVAIVYGLLVVAPQPNVLQFLHRSLLLLTGAHAFTKEFFFPGANFLLWSLGVEIWFSVFFPLFVVAIHRISVRWLLGSVFVIALLSRFLGLWFDAYHGFYYWNDSVGYLYDHVFCRMDDFALGMGLAYLFVHHPAFLKRFASYTLGFVLVLTAFTFRDYMVLGWIPPYLRPFTNSLQQIGMFCSIAAFLMKQTVVSRLLTENIVIQMLGLMCYSLYIWHGIAVQAIRPTDSAAQFVYFLLVVFIVSLLSYRFIEFGYVRETKKLLPIRSRE